ncbi:MAG TPA: hypothetical protein VLG69_00020 [Candidatus Andersenbacteria bacterium]|nr:hypothetical protein [Candidatus Andersenbacteria bacterium]
MKEDKPRPIHPVLSILHLLLIVGTLFVWLAAINDPRGLKGPYGIVAVICLALIIISNYVLFFNNRE